MAALGIVTTACMLPVGALLAPSGTGASTPEDGTRILISVLTVVPCDPECPRPPLRAPLERVGRSSLLVSEES